MRPQVLAASLCTGLVLANVARVGLALIGVALALAAATVPRLAFAAVCLVLVGWWWGSIRLDALDRSALAAHIGEAGRVRVVVTGPARLGSFSIRVPALVVRFERRPLHEPTLLQLAKGRAPPQGTVLSALAVVKQPRGPTNGFDERTWLRRHGVHAVLRVDEWHIVGRRGGFGGVADALRRQLSRSIALGLRGERAAVVEGVVLGEEGGLSRELRDRFRAAGLFHLLAVSGQNVVLVGGSVLVVAWLLGLSRLLAELGALAAIAAYVLAVGAQPSVIRAGVAGALCSVAWLTARAADRWQLLFVGAIVLLAWNPYTLFDVGFQLSFAAVVAIFLLVPRLQTFLEGYPLGRLRPVVARSAAGGRAPAPSRGMEFHTVERRGVRHCADPLDAVPLVAAAGDSGQRARGACCRAAPRTRVRSGRGRATFRQRRCRPCLAQRLVCCVPGGRRSGHRRSAVRTDPVDAHPCSRTRRRLRGRRLCFGSS